MWLFIKIFALKLSCLYYMGFSQFQVHPNINVKCSGQTFIFIFCLIRCSSRLVCWVPLRKWEMKNWHLLSPWLSLSAVVSSWEGSLWRWWSRGTFKTVNPAHSVMVWQKITNNNVHNSTFFSPGMLSIQSSTTYAHSWMSNTGHGWRCTTRSSLCWRVLKLRRSSCRWRRTMRRCKLTWLMLWPRRRNWRKRWCLSCRRGMICSCKQHL